MKFSQYFDLSVILIKICMMIMAMVATVTNSNLSNNNTGVYHHHHQHHHHQQQQQQQHYHQQQQQQQMPLKQQQQQRQHRTTSQIKSPHQIFLMANRKLPKKKLNLKSSLQSIINGGASILIPFKRTFMSTPSTTALTLLSTSTSSTTTSSSTPSPSLSLSLSLPSTQHINMGQENLIQRDHKKSHNYTVTLMDRPFKFNQHNFQYATEPKQNYNYYQTIADNKNHHNYHSYNNMIMENFHQMKTYRFHGDDNSNDVEFIGNENMNKFLPNVVKHHNGPIKPPINVTTIATSTATPISISMPPLVPVRRGYGTPITSIGNGHVSTETENPNDMNLIGSILPNSFDAKEMEKRHICVQQRTILIPEKKTEIYNRPILRHISVPCLQRKQEPKQQHQQQQYYYYTHHQHQNQHEQQQERQQQQQPHQQQHLCTRIQLTHEPSYRDVVHHKTVQQLIYDCCNGWSRHTINADACMKPVCSTPCYNGGTCILPDVCNCTMGFRGRYCEQDVNECIEKKLCDQVCINTIGSYYCRCRDGFNLQMDQQSCRKIDQHNDDAFEARDMEHDLIDMQESVVTRIQKIEKTLINEKVRSNDLEKTLHNTYKTIDILKSRLINLEKQQLDMNRLQLNLYNTQKRLLKLEGMFNLLLKCRNGPNENCP